MADKVALVEFPRSSFGQLYSYLTDIEDLNAEDLVLVQTRTSYSIAVFKAYTDKEYYISVAKSRIVTNLAKDIEAFEEKLFLGGFD